MSDPPTRVRIHTPAKINLGLRVLGKRLDGYHEIETLFIAVSLFDEFILERHRDGASHFSIEAGSDDPGIGSLTSGEDNLVWRAVREFERAVGHSVEVDIHLKKSIPIAAGLGGGSSDAAATLIGLQTLYPGRIGVSQIHELAANIGSDVPFFLGAPAAMGRGRGERLTPIAIDLTWYALLICPRVPSPTGPVYAALDLTSLPKMSDFPPRLEGDGFFAALALIHNDLQDVVVRQVPQVLHWKKHLLTLGAEGAYVSGSGPSIFGVFRDKPDASVHAAIRSQGAEAFVVRPLNTKMTMVIEPS